MNEVQANLGKAVRAFHEDENGMEALQAVMIVGVAALILIALKAFWPKIQAWWNREFSNVEKPL